MDLPVSGIHTPQGQAALDLEAAGFPEPSCDDSIPATMTTLIWMFRIGKIKGIDSVLGSGAYTAARAVILDSLNSAKNPFFGFIGNFRGDLSRNALNGRSGGQGTIVIRAPTGWNGHKRDCFWNLDPGTRHPPRTQLH